MNELETEYSFLAPTWKLPIVATTSMYARPYGTSYLSNSLDTGPDISLWQSTKYNPRYIPSTIVPGSYNYQRTVPPTNYPQQQNYQPPGGRSTQPHHSYSQQPNNINPDDGLNLTTSLHPNDNNKNESHSNPYNNYGQTNHQMVNRGLTYATNNQNHSHPPPSQKRRVQIIDHNRHTPSTVANEYRSDRNSRNSNNTHSYSRQNHTPDANRNHYNHTPTDRNQPHYNHTPTDRNQPHYNHTPIDRNRAQQKPRQLNAHREHHEENRFGYTGNNFNIHEYLYGSSDPDPGSYANAYKQHQRRLQDEKVGRKSVASEYKNFTQNGGLGPSFGHTEHLTYEDKIEGEKRRKTYAKSVRETNQHKIEEQKRMHQNNGQQKTRTAPVPKYQRAREYADKIEKPHHMKPVFQIESSPPIIITSLSNIPRQTNFDNVQSLNLINFLSHEFNIDRSRRASSSSSITRRRQYVRFHHRGLSRPQSSTAVDLPSRIIGIGLSPGKDSSSISKKLPGQIKNFEDLKSSSNRSLQSSYKNEKKSIKSHSMIMTKNMRLPPTASVLINQTYNFPFMTTSTTKKSHSNKDLKSPQRPFTANSIPNPIRKTTLNLDLQIKPFHSNSSDE